MPKLTVKKEIFSLKSPFRIAHGTRYNSEVIVVEITDENISGKGEAVPYKRYNETCESVIEQIKSVQNKINKGIDLKTLQKIMPNGAARNAIDCALWDLKAKQQKKHIWEIAGLPKPKTINTVFTLVIDSPDNMAREAKEKTKLFSTLKLKLAGDEIDKDRMLAVHNAAPNSKIIIDANESWNEKLYLNLIGACQKSNVQMIEQPFKASQDEILATLPRPIDICADEACHVTSDLANLVGKYDMVNIKLDKTGGLTEAINLFKEAKKLNFKIMVGCMVGTSLSMRPAYYIAQMADLVDIDGPLLLKEDRDGGLIYTGSRVSEGTLDNT